jgi:hypothetical protein
MFQLMGVGGWGGAGGGANSISKNERLSLFVLVFEITVIFWFLRVVEDKETILTILLMKNILERICSYIGITVEACSRYLLMRAGSIVHIT